MLAYGVLVWLIAVVLIVCAFIVEWRSLDRTLEKLSELPDQRYLLPLGPIGTLCAGSDEAGRDSDIAVGGQRNPPSSSSPLSGHPRLKGLTETSIAKFVILELHMESIALLTWGTPLV